jgi:hypothetical protein
MSALPARALEAPGERPLHAVESGWTIAMAASFYGIPAVEYQRARQPFDGFRRGLLVGSGCGLMMALMDALPFRWCVDADAVRGADRDYRLAQFIAMAHALEFAALAGWFSLTCPRALREAFASLQPAPLVYSGDMRLGLPWEVDSLDSFIWAARALFE